MDAITTNNRIFALRKHVNILKAKGYRGFRLIRKELKGEFTIEVGALNNLGDRLIAIGNTLDEAYENLVRRIDQTLDT